jgi:hypothetical protein
MSWIERLQSLDEESESLGQGTAETVKRAFRSFRSTSPQISELFQLSRARLTAWSTFDRLGSGRSSASARMVRRLPAS